jgi:Zn finger protein HypA/HybF involved in hydrogenase expression
MSLPMNTTPSYTLEIPSTKTKVKYRPFLVREEKALLIAQQSEDPEVMINTLKEVIAGCIKDDIDVDSLATFDLEYLFTQIRSKSVGEEIELIFPCTHCNDEKAKVKIKFDLTNIKVQTPDNHTKKVELFGDVGVMMKYPTIEVIDKIESLNSNDIDAVFGVVAGCIDYIYDSSEIYYAKEQTKDELMEFLNNLTSDQFAKIQEFFQTMPKLKQEVDYKCPVCGADNHTVLEGLASFF